MKIETLVKHCLQYLEQDADVNVINETIEDLQESDVFAEYMNNIESSLYRGITQFVNALILPLQEKEFELGNVFCDLRENGSNRLIYKQIQDVYAIEESGNVVFGIPYVVIGSKILIKYHNENCRYYVVYNPNIQDLRFYNENIFEIELNELGIPDEMAEQLVYFVYSDMKLEENPSVAINNKNVFEAYLQRCEVKQISTQNIVMDENDEWGSFA